MKTVNGIVTKYVYGRGLIGEAKQDTPFKTYHFDYRGSTAAITDANGNITDRFEYDTYGKQTEHTGSSFVIFGYNGRDGVVTDNNGLIYMRARYYNPELKRFINADVLHGEIADSTSLNRYSYVNGNPVSFVDPVGLSKDDRGNTSSDNKPVSNLTQSYTEIIWESLEKSVTAEGTYFSLPIPVSPFTTVTVSLSVKVGNGAFNINDFEDFLNGKVELFNTVLLEVQGTDQAELGMKLSEGYAWDKDTGVSWSFKIVGTKVTAKYEVEEQISDTFSHSTSIEIETVCLRPAPINDTSSSSSQTRGQN